MSNTIPSHEKCSRCNKNVHIKNLNICTTCKKILCNACKIYLARNTGEINFDYHYCVKDGDEPGEFVKIYNK